METSELHGRSLVSGKLFSCSGSSSFRSFSGGGCKILESNILFQGRPLVGTYCIATVPSLSFYQLLVHSTSKERRGTSDLAAVVAVNTHEASLVTKALHYGRKCIAPQDLLGVCGGEVGILEGAAIEWARWWDQREIFREEIDNTSGSKVGVAVYTEILVLQFLVL